MIDSFQFKLFKKFRPTKIKDLKCNIFSSTRSSGKETLWNVDFLHQKTRNGIVLNVGGFTNLLAFKVPTERMMNILLRIWILGRTWGFSPFFSNIVKIPLVSHYRSFMQLHWTPKSSGRFEILQRPKRLNILTNSDLFNSEATDFALYIMFVVIGNNLIYYQNVV